MKVILINIYPQDPLARYMLSCYVLKGYLASVQPALEVEVLNFHDKVQADEVIKAVEASAADVIGYSCYVWNMNLVLQVMAALGQSGRFRHVLGGPEISLDLAEHYLKQGLGHYYVIGEGEYSLAALLKALQEPERGFAGLEGVAYLEDGALVYRPGMERIDLDEIPSVYLGNVIDPALVRGQKAYLETQRGCIYRCSYCVYHKHISHIHYYPIERVLEEISYLVTQCRIRSLRIFDAVFTSDLDRAKGIVSHLLQLKENSGGAFPWIYWEFHYKDVDEDFLALVGRLKDGTAICNSGAIKAEDRPQLYFDMLRGYNVINSIGIQSFNDASLKAVGRAPLNVEGFMEFMAWVNRHNVVLKIDLILGLPFETADTFFAGLETLLPLVRGTDHIVNIHQLQILPGSRLADRAETLGIRYSIRAPHYVDETTTLSRSEMKLVARLSALLFRLVNSPLRESFFAFWPSEQPLVDCLTGLYRQLEAHEGMKASRLISGDTVDDEYWNQEIFSDIGSALLAALLTAEEIR